MPLPASRGHRIEPYAVLTVGESTQTFYLGDCLEVFRSLPPGSVSAIVTSPPYNLGVRYRSYDDSIPRRDYLAWTDRWVEAARTVLDPRGSLFLNVGAIPLGPVGGDGRRPDREETPHAPEHAALGQVHRDRQGRHRRGRDPRARPGYRPLQTDQQRAVRQRLSRVRLSLHAGRTHAARPAGGWRRVSGCLQYRPLADRRQQSPMPGQHLVHSLRDDQEPRQGSSPSGDVSVEAGRATVSGSTAAIASRSPWIPFSASGAAPSPPRN